jgi:flagellar hook-basal body complex protein FliE
MSEEIPVLTPTPEHKMLSTDDCVKMVQEISKTLIAEHTKLLAMALQKTPQSEPLEVSKTLEEMKKRVEGNQQQSGETAENTKFKVVNDLHKMVGN